MQQIDTAARDTSRTLGVTSLVFRVLNWIVRADANYRQAHKLRNATDEQLADMGMTRRDAAEAFRPR
jgi:uncharacterized protein YjiS (DUF1127 family)